MRLRTGKRDGRRGAALLEMAILLPFLAFLFIVTLDFCRVFYSSQTVQNCAYVAGLYAGGTANGAPGSSADDAAKQAAVAEGTRLSPPLKAENVTITPGDGVVTVTVSYDFTMIVGFPGHGRTLTLVRTVTLPTAPKVGQ